MTREEIIDFCEMRSQLEPENEDIFNYITEVLRKETCEDAVSRQAVNELFDSEIKMYKERIETRKGSNYHDETERIKEFRSRIANAEYWQNKIKALPPVTPTRENTKWVIKATGFPPEPMTVCAKCGFEKDFNIRAVGYDKIKYCPNCGRKFAEIPTGLENVTEIHCNFTDAEMAKEFIKDVKAVKDWLPRAERRK